MAHGPWPLSFIYSLIPITLPLPSEPTISSVTSIPHRQPLHGQAAVGGKSLWLKDLPKLLASSLSRFDSIWYEFKASFRVSFPPWCSLFWLIQGKPSSIQVYLHSQHPTEGRIYRVGWWMVFAFRFPGPKVWPQSQRNHLRKENYTALNDAQGYTRRLTYQRLLDSDA